MILEEKPYLNNELNKPEIIFNNTFNCEIILTNNKEVIDISPNCSFLTGYSKEEFLINKILIQQLILPKDLHFYDDVFNKESYNKATFRIKTKSGNIKWVELQCVLINNNHDGFNGFHCNMIDITQQKTIEFERNALFDLMEIINKSKDIESLLKTSCSYLKEWVDCDAIGIRLKQGYDFPYYETIGFSEKFVKAEKYLCAYDYLGNLIKDAEGNPVLECMCGNIICGRFDSGKPFFSEKGSFWSNNTSALLANTTEKDRQARTRNRCNGEGYESVGLFPIKYNDITYGLLQINDKKTGLFTENSIVFFEKYAENLAIALKNKYNESHLKESEKKLLELNSSLNRLFAIIAHDLKNPMISVMHLSELISKCISRDNIDKALKFAEHINTNIKSTYHLLENLLEWSSSRQKGIQYKPEFIYGKQFIEENIKQLKHLALKKKIKLIIEPFGDFQFYADKNMISSVLRNLITNAIKFSFKESEVIVKVLETQIDYRFSIIDSGIGMDKVTLKDVFKIGHDLKTIGTADEKGTGLGLLICKEFIDKHKGKIWVESELGIGSTFSFSIPKS